MDKQVSPALKEAPRSCVPWASRCRPVLGQSRNMMGLRVMMEEGNPFVYEVSLDGYLAAPSEAASRMRCASASTAPRCTCTTAARNTT
jgi:choline/glycine/proline betaine transport protein